MTDGWRVYSTRLNGIQAQHLYFCRYLVVNHVDVWSFGILIHEILSNGKLPYATMEAGGVLEFLKNGKRMECPENASDEVYEIMCSCWEENVETRISFSELSTKFKTILFRETQDYGEVELEDEDLGLKKIGLKIIKEAGKEGYPVTAKTTKKKMFFKKRMFS